MTIFGAWRRSDQASHRAGALQLVRAGKLPDDLSFGVDHTTLNHEEWCGNLAEMSKPSRAPAGASATAMRSTSSVVLAYPCMHYMRGDFIQP